MLRLLFSITSWMVVFMTGSVSFITVTMMVVFMVGSVSFTTVTMIMLLLFVTIGAIWVRIEVTMSVGTSFYFWIPSV